MLSMAAVIVSAEWQVQDLFFTMLPHLGRLELRRMLNTLKFNCDLRRNSIYLVINIFKSAFL